jgi:hypothetical protein
MLAFLSIVNVLVLVRLFLIRNESPVPAIRVMSGAAIVCGSVAAVVQGASPWQTITAAAFAAAVVLAMLLTEQAEARKRLWYRVALLVLGLIVLAFAAESWGLMVRPTIVVAVEGVRAKLVVHHLIPQRAGIPVTAGILAVLLCLDESSMLVVAILHAFHVKVNETQGEPPFKGIGDTSDANRSALVGVVERLLILIFASHNAYNAIAFILTAKTFARNYESQGDPASKPSATFVLIGTLVSTLIAIIIAILLLPVFGG